MRVTGRVKFFKDREGYGFIQPDDGAPDVFVHRTDLQDSCAQRRGHIDVSPLIETAFEEERKRGQTVLFPVRLDDTVLKTNEAWAAKLRARHIGDFRQWKNHDQYQKTLERMLRDLKVDRKSTSQ